MAIPDWRDTILWQRLQDNDTETEPTKQYVQLCLDEVQTILSSGGTAPLDFTLHDDQHSYRVAQRMAELLPERTLNSLSCYEIALLLTSAYLHDIGMNPKRRLIKDLRNHLLTGNDADVLGTEAFTLEAWLDEHHSGMQPPIKTSVSGITDIEIVDELVAYYSRERHNEWSEQYILEMSSRWGPLPYSTWTEDLISLCKSHHYSVNDLLRNSFDLRIVGPGNKLVNLRYLAAILRIADVMEFDPERTPQVVLEHRDIAKSSRIYWRKDQTMIISLAIKTGDVQIMARTKDAWIHKAVIETADSVDEELQNCSALEKQNAFLKGFRVGTADYYVWPWQPRVIRDIQPMSNAFEYIDGAFRPDTDRVLNLLAGTRLYGSPLAAVRELLQNAFDAVWEQIAYETLSSVSSDVKTQLSARMSLHSVDLSIEETDGATWLVCVDSGCGMTRRVIDKYLLVTGSKTRREILRVKRELTQLNVNFGRSGEFGIGVLSYFMIADKLVINTRAGLEGYEEAENHGWRFETGGLGSFGELRTLQKLPRGTEVRLRLKEKFLSNDFFDELMDFIHNSLAKTPCNFSAKIGDKFFSSVPGWVDRQDAILNRSLYNLKGRNIIDDNLISNQRRDESLIEDKNWRDIKNRAKKSVSLFGSEEAEIAGNRGSVRVRLPFFQLEGGASLDFIDIRDGTINPFPDYKLIYSMGSASLTSWRGFSVDVSNRLGLHFDRNDFRSEQRLHNVSFAVELDIQSGGSISIDRTHLDVDSDYPAETCLQCIFNKITNEFFENNIKSQYVSLSSEWALFAEEHGQKVSRYWACLEYDDCDDDESNHSLVWREVRFPAVLVPSPLDTHNEPLPNYIKSMQGWKDELRPIESRHTEVWPLPTRSPSRIVLRDRLLDPVLLFEDDLIPRTGGYMTADMPDEWHSLIGIQFSKISVLNRGCRVFKLAAEGDWDDYKRAVAGLNALEIIELLVRKERSWCAMFLLSNTSSSTEFWRALRDNKPEEYSTIMSRIDDSDTSHLVWKPEYKSGVRQISSMTIAFCEGYYSSRSKELTKLLPVPSRDWYMSID